jgi:hypothetical protein
MLVPTDLQPVRARTDPSGLDGGIELLVGAADRTSRVVCAPPPTPHRNVTAQCDLHAASLSATQGACPARLYIH